MKKTSGKKQLERLAALPDDSINLSDIPERLDWSEAERGKFYRPIKKSVTMRIDADVLERFRAQGGAYQTRINEALREFVARERKGKRTA